MAQIDIDIKKIRTANYSLPNQKTELDSIRRGLGLMRWKIPKEIQNEKEIGDRIIRIIEELERLESEMDDIYLTTNVAVKNYMENENGLVRKASLFK